MTAPGGGDPYRNQPGPWQQYQHPPVDPQAPLNYPDYPTGPQQIQPPPYGYPPQQPYGQPTNYGQPTGYGYGAPPPTYPYDPYRPYPSQTNSLAVASLATSIAGIFLGIPLAIFCFFGWLIPVIGAVLGGVALSQIKRTGQQGRGLAIAGIAIGTGTAALLTLFLVIFTAAMMHVPTFIQ